MTDQWIDELIFSLRKINDIKVTLWFTRHFMRLRDTSLFPRMHHPSEKPLICLCQGQKCFKQKNVIWSNFQGRSHVLDTVLDPRICYWQSWKIKKAKLWRQNTREAKVSRSTHSKIYRHTLLQHMQINYPKARNGLPKRIRERNIQHSYRAEK